MIDKKTFRTNNFDLIRLLAALQVVISHTLRHLEIGSRESVFTVFFEMFPGVPIFFFTSGLLISKSYENSKSVKSYFRNRFLRIYPALIVCTVLTLISVWVSGYFATIDLTVTQFIPWFLSQITFVQFYNPDFMRDFGTGVLNGSLWTIAVELQFYLFVPFVYLILKGTRKKQNIILGTLTIFFMMFHIWRSSNYDARHTEIAYKLFNVSFVPWVYMFLLGIIVQKNFEVFYNFLKNKAVIVFPLYLFAGYLTLLFGLKLGSNLNPLLFLILVALILSSAYTLPSLSNKLLHGNDISYGIYIYHIPIVNVLMYNDLGHHIGYLGLVILAAVAFALTSWIFVERPVLRLKSSSIKS